jgi:TRAP-type C4-dicarboxylate transport system substrate-binding protein
MSEDKEAVLKKVLTDNGMTILEPSPTFMNEFNKIGATLLADWEKKAGAQGTALIADYRKLVPAK